MLNSVIFYFGTSEMLAPAGEANGYTKETISKLLLLRNIYKDVSKRPEEIYKPFGLNRATF